MMLDGYIRISKIGGREGEGYISPTVQRESIAAYATELGGEIVAWEEDQDYTGGNMDRPGFQRTLDRLRTGKTDGVVVMDMSRFSRSSADGLAIVREIVDRGQVFASATEHMDPKTPTGAFMLRQFLSNAELFLDQAKAKWKDAKARAIKRGAPIGAVTFGYRRVKSPPTRPNHISPVDAAALVGGEPASGTLVPDPVTGPIVTEMFQRAAKGESLSDIAVWLCEVHPAENRRPWAAGEVRRWLTNRTYLGEVRYGDLSSVDAHLPLTDPETFAAAAPGAARSKRPSVALPLVGLLRCGNCHEVMVGNTYGGTRHDTPVYRCDSRCGGGSVMVARRVHDYIFDVAQEAMAGYVLAATGTDYAELDAAVEDAEAELDAFVGNLSIRSAIGEAKWEEGVKLRADALDRVVGERNAALSADEFATVDLSNPSDQDLTRFAFAAMDSVIVRRAPRGAGADERLEIVWAGEHVKR